MTASEKASRRTSAKQALVEEVRTLLEEEVTESAACLPKRKR